MALGSWWATSSSWRTLDVRNSRVSPRLYARGPHGDRLQWRVVLRPCTPTALLTSWGEKKNSICYCGGGRRPNPAKDRVCCSRGREASGKLHLRERGFGGWAPRP